MTFVRSSGWPGQKKKQNDRAVARRPAAPSTVSRPTRIVPLVKVVEVSTVEVGVVWVEGSTIYSAVVEETSLEYLFLGLAI